MILMKFLNLNLLINLIGFINNFFKTFNMIYWEIISMCNNDVGTIELLINGFSSQYRFLNLQ
jgi:hypothetical protein